MAIEQPLPSNTDIEEALLGSLVIDPQAIHRVASIVQPHDLYSEANGTIYGAMLAISKKQAFDVLQLRDLLERRGHLEAVGGMERLTLLLNASPTSLHVEHYARHVAAYAVRRRLIAAAGKIAGVAFDTNSADPLSEARALLLAVDDGAIGDVVPVSAALSDLYDQVEQWANNPLMPGQVRGLSTGIPSLDLLTDGLQPGELVLMAGRPAMGKSAIAFEIARRVADQGKSVALFSLEMTQRRILFRWLAALSGIAENRVKRGLCPDELAGQAVSKQYITSDELSTLFQHFQHVDNLPIHIIDTPGLSADVIRARSLAIGQQSGLDLVIVDHSGLMRGIVKRGENSAKSEGRKSQVMKELSKELGCPVLLVQQLNRAVEGRNDKRPTLADLRDSGEHEQNADIVMGLYRDSYYQKGMLSPGSRKDLELEILCLKHRHGSQNTKAVVKYERHLSRFSEFERKGYD